MSISRYNFVAEDDVWEMIDKSKEFNAFIGMCLSDFMARIISNDTLNEILEQDYEIPEEIETIESSILLRKLPNKKINIQFCRW